MDILERWAVLTEKIDVYNVYGKCWQKKSNTTIARNQPHFAIKNGQFESVSDERKLIRNSENIGKFHQTPWLNNALKNHKGPGEVPPCVYAENLISYFNRQDVKDALHIDPMFSSDYQWTMCVKDYGQNYTMDIKASQYIWEMLIEDGSYKLLKFSGDMDMSVPSLGTQGWIDAMNLNEVKEWREWDLDNLTAGYVTEYEGGLVYSTVHQAGHMVPQD